MYRQDFPDNHVFFNCNILIDGWGKIWFGDLDVTKSKEVLVKIATQLNHPLYIFREHDARFGSEKENWDTLKPKAVCTIIPA